MVLMETMFERVYALVSQIPAGRVATYGQIAWLLGNPRLSRAVGYALASCPDHRDIPCHRVVGSNGSLTGYAGGLQKKLRLLQLEGTDTGPFFLPQTEPVL